MMVVMMMMVRIVHARSNAKRIPLGQKHTYSGVVRGGAERSGQQLVI
jgi:hypothetical protein